MTVLELQVLHRADRGAALLRLRAGATDAIRSCRGRLVISLPDAEDLVADLVAEAAAGTPMWLGGAPATTALGPWLARVLRNRWRARLRETARSRATLRQEAGGLARECSSEADELREKASSSRWTDCDELRRLLALLPFRQRSAIGLKLEGHTFTEISRIMRVRRDTAADLVRKAKHSLGELAAGRTIGPERCAVPPLSVDEQARLSCEQSRLYSMATAGESRSTISMVLRCKPKTVKNRLARLRKRLRRTA